MYETITRDGDTIPMPGDHVSDYYGIELPRRMAKAGLDYFSRENLRYFDGRFDSTAREVTPNQYVLVDSTRPPLFPGQDERDPREYRVQVVTFYPTGERYQREYATISRIAAHATKRAANAHRDNLAAELADRYANAE